MQEGQSSDLTDPSTAKPIQPERLNYCRFKHMLNNALMNQQNHKSNQRLKRLFRNAGSVIENELNVVMNAEADTEGQEVVFDPHVHL